MSEEKKVERNEEETKAVVEKTGKAAKQAFQKCDEKYHVNNWLCDSAGNPLFD